MDINAIREALHRQPFHSFTIRLVDGREFLIPHPDFIAVSHRAVVVISPHNDAITILEPLLIISLEVAGDGQPAGSHQTNSG
jgi:hypothetical protein